MCYDFNVQSLSNSPYEAKRLVFYLVIMGSRSHESIRGQVNMDNEIIKIRKLFDKQLDGRASNVAHSLSDILMSGYAMFALKYTSLLNFDEQTTIERENLSTIYGVNRVCSDTTLRRVLDSVAPDSLKQHFAQRFANLKATGLLKEYEYQIGSKRYLISSCDGVQHFSSKSVSCDCCLTKKHRDGTTTYHHNMLCTALVHPEKREVFIMGCEPIVRNDGTVKNDCELNAAKRLYTEMASNYAAFLQQYNFLVVEDALYANGPHLRQLQANGYNFVINVKPKSHKVLFAQIEGSRERKHLKVKTHSEGGIKHRFEWRNNVVLHDRDPSLRVNFLHYEQTDKKGKKTIFTWITDINLNARNVYRVMRAGRSRWKIENETFNTLKNLGYNFEHNYGHGDDHLSTVLSYLMLQAFYTDQFIQACSTVFKQIEQAIRTKIRLWQTMQALFKTISCSSFDFIYRRIALLYEVKIE
jgi:hypothetical protein